MGHKLAYRVLSPLRHNGKTYSPSDSDIATVELTEEEAATLPPGVLGEAVAVEPPAEEADRIAAILAHVPGFKVDDFTKAGGLKAAALRDLTARLGWEPSADDITGALKAFADARPKET